MNSRVEVAENDFKLPKQRDFLPAKKYREAIKKWGEPNQLVRKRVIIVPSIKCEARDVDVQRDYSRSKSTAAVNNGDHSSSAGGLPYSQDANSDSLSAEAKYKKWLAERKKLRSILNNSGLNQDWLTKKNNKTALEDRVLKRMKLAGKPDIVIKKVLPDVVTEDDVTGVDKGVPMIRQPSPAALAMIQAYLEKRRLRLVDLFVQADKDKNWIVSRNEFRNIIRAAGIPITEPDLEDLIMTLDKDENDALDYRELAVGRQAYIEERNERKSISATTPLLGPKLSKISTSELDKDNESDGIKPTDERQAERPSSPQRPSSPAHSPSPTTLDRPDSSPARPGSPLPLGILSRSSSSPSLLDLPPTETSEKVERPSQDQIKEKRMKKQQKRKEKEKAKTKKKPVEKPTVAPSTLGGTTGEIVDRYRKLTLKQYHDTVELCQMHGVQLSKGLLGRVLLQPEDKPVDQCIPPRPRHGRFAITTRHHVPASTRNQTPGSKRGQRSPSRSPTRSPTRAGPDWVT